MRYLLFLTLLLTNLAFADEVSQVYLVYPSSFTQLDFDKLKDYGHLSHRVGIKVTQLLRAANTHYYVLEITTVTNTQNTILLNAESSGKIFKIGERQWHGHYDSQWGGVREYVTENWIHHPKETLEPWRVESSTP